MKVMALWRAMLPATVAAAWIMAACDTRRDDDSMEGVYEDRNEGAEVAPPAMEPAGGTLTDQDIILRLREANMADSALGRLAAQKATHKSVRAFGERMQKEHHAAQEAVNEVAQKLNLATATDGMQGGAMQRADNEMQRMRDSLQNMARGREWDRAYIDREVRAHEQALELLTRAQTSTQREEVKDLLEELAPDFQSHLEQAREIQRSLQETEMPSPS